MKMRKLLVVAAAAFALCLPAHAQTAKNKAALQAEINSSFPDNTVGQITPAIARAAFSDFLASWQQYTAVNPQVGTTYPFAASDYGQLVTFNNAAPVAVTLPNPSTTGFTPWNVYVRNLGAGTVTITPTGSNINAAATLVLGQNQSASIVSDGTNYQTWFNNSSSSPFVAGPASSTIGNVATWANSTGTLLADGGTAVRQRLSGPLTIYASTGGTGIACTVGSPCTVAQAISNALNSYDAAGSGIIIQLANGTYTGANVQITGNVLGGRSAGTNPTQLAIQGDCTNSANVTVNGASANAFTFVGVVYPIMIKCLTITTTTSGSGVASDFGSKVYYAKIIWGTMAAGGIHAIATYQSMIEQEDVETISGNAAVHWYMDRSSQILTTGNTITCTGSPAFSSGFVAIFNGSNFALNSAAFSGCGSVTGLKYLADNTASFGSSSADPNTVFPGNANGSVGVPSFGLTGLLVGQGGPPTGGTNLMTTSDLFTNGFTLGNSASANVVTAFGDQVVTKAAAALNVSYAGNGGVNYFLKDTNAGTNLKFFQLNSAAGVTTLRDLTDLGAVQHTFLTFNQTTGLATSPALGPTKVAWSSTAPTIASGFCSSPSISANNGTAAFQITIGSACAASTGVLTLPAAGVGWACDFRNITNPATSKPDQTAGGSATSVTVTNFVRTTGVAGNWTAADVIVAMCTAY